MTQVISVMLVRGKKDQFVTKTAWQVRQLTSVCGDSECGHYTPDSGFFGHWCKPYQAPLNETGALTAVFTVNDFMGFSVKQVHIFPVARLSCEKQSQGHRIILVMITSDLRPTWGSIDKLLFKRINTLVKSPGNTELRNSGEETHFLSHWGCWYFSYFPLLLTALPVQGDTLE